MRSLVLATIVLIFQFITPINFNTCQAKETIDKPDTSSDERRAAYERSQRISELRSKSHWLAAEYELPLLAKVESLEGRLAQTRKQSADQSEILQEIQNRLSSEKTARSVLDSALKNVQYLASNWSATRAALSVLIRELQNRPSLSPARLLSEMIASGSATDDMKILGTQLWQALKYLEQELSYSDANCHAILTKIISESDAELFQFAFRQLNGEVLRLDSSIQRAQVRSVEVQQKLNGINSVISNLDGELRNAKSSLEHYCKLRKDLDDEANRLAAI